VVKKLFYNRLKKFINIHNLKNKKNKRFMFISLLFDAFCCLLASCFDYVHWVTSSRVRTNIIA
jgi:hypothetical protein